MLEISHVDRQKNPQFDSFFKRKFNEHVVKHFGLIKNQIDASLGVASTGIDSLLSLNYHYGKQHYHLRSNGSNIYESASKLIAELEKLIRRKKQTSLRKRKKGFRKNHDVYDLGYDT